MFRVWRWEDLNFFATIEEHDWPHRFKTKLDLYIARNGPLQQVVVIVNKRRTQSSLSDTTPEEADEMLRYKYMNHFRFGRMSKRSNDQDMKYEYNQLHEVVSINGK